MDRAGCQGCKGGEVLPFEFTMAFHPIVDVSNGTVWGHEALVRGINGEGAGQILGQVTEANRYKFDQACRVKAIELAGGLFPPDGTTKLSINFMPNAVYEPAACIRATLDAAHRIGFEHRQIMFEFTENERMTDIPHVQRIIEEYRKQGFATAIDDFGAGYAGLNLLAHFQPDFIKIDMELIRDVTGSPAKQTVVACITTMARELGVAVIAEGIETEAELSTLRAVGIILFQGYLFAKPSIASLPPVPLLETLVPLSADGRRPKLPAHAFVPAGTSSAPSVRRKPTAI